MTAPKTVLVPVANGSEDLETAAIANVLVRAGAKVTLASVEEDVNMLFSRGLHVQADCLISYVLNHKFDLIALPGGLPGANTLRDCDDLKKMCQKQVEEGRLLGAICATPAVALKTWGLLENRKATCHPGFAKELVDCKNDRVVEDGNVITSRGPGTALEFALRLVSRLYGHDAAVKVAEPMLVHEGDI